MDQAGRGKSQVRIGHTLSEAEKHVIKERLPTVQSCLQNHGINVPLNELPNIALLGSGGGTRAMVALLGSLWQLHEDDLLDSIMYLSGVSGSTWCMASLYEKSDWSNNLESIKNGIVDRLVNGNVTVLEHLHKLVKYSKKDNFSMTDVWSVFIITRAVKKIDEHSISALSRDRDNRSNDPYPIFTVIDQTCKHDGLDKDLWFEITPDEAGYSLTGAFVNSSAFESEFSKGSEINSCPEADMLYLQGLCGRALADAEENKKYIWETIQSWARSLFTKTQTFSLKLDSEMENAFEMKNAFEMENASEVELACGYANCCFGRKRSFGSHRTHGGTKKQFGEILYKRVALSGTGSEEVYFEQKTLSISPCSWLTNFFEGASDTSSAIKKTYNVASSWTWGTTYNLLHNKTVDGIPSSLLNTKTRYYEDAGLKLNSPYFSVLRKERQTDLIISLDFSSGDPFETLKITAKLCKDLEIPFPDIVIDDPEPSEPQDLYVFSKENAPTVIHIPLFNAVNCPGKVKEYGNKYGTTTLTYTSDMISDLLEKAGLNIKNNKEKLLEEIQKIIAKKKRADNS